MSYPAIGNMKPVPKKGFPEIDNLCLDVSTVLNGNLHPRIKQQVLDGALWWMADYSGKGLDCPFRSKRANQICKSLGSGDEIKNRGLIHEHIVPKKLIREKLMALNTPVDKKTVKRWLKLSVYCLVTKESDDKVLNKSGFNQKMPNDNWKKENAIPDEIWARYKASGIEVVDRR